MPLDDYRCQDCATTFEALMRGGQVPPCPACDSVRLDRCLLLSAVPGKTAGFVRKGSAQVAREGGQ